MAESRLRIIEKISKYREEKIKREFWKLELELQEENEKLREENEMLCTEKAELNSNNEFEQGYHALHAFFLQYYFDVLAVVFPWCHQ